MTFTYTLPVAGAFEDPKDEVRLLALDTVEGPFSASDEALAYYLAREGGSVRLAAADALEERAEKLQAAARKEIQVGPFRSMALNELTAASLRERAAVLRAGGGPGALAPLVGLTDSGELPDVPVFDLGMNDYPGALRGGALRLEP